MKFSLRSKDDNMKYPDTQFIRALGILLIINSHLDQYYPIPYIATGGAIGNSIFFFLSAFGIYLSQQKNNKPFKEWIGDRISRIYPSLWIVLILVVMPLMISNGKLSASTIPIFIGYFFSPYYWFLQAILVYYLFTYYLLKSNQQKIIGGIFLVLSVIYFSIYFSWVDLSKWSIEKSPFDLLHYFMIFLFGIFIAARNEKIKYTGFNNYLILIFFIALIYAHKFMMIKGLYSEFQFIQHAAMYPIVYYFLKVSRSPIVLTGVMKSKIITPIARFLSDHTLEIYMIHETINYPVSKLQLPFPTNVLLFLILTFILAAIVYKLATLMRNKIN